MRRTGFPKFCRFFLLPGCFSFLLTDFFTPLVGGLIGSFAMGSLVGFVRAAQKPQMLLLSGGVASGTLLASGAGWAVASFILFWFGSMLLYCRPKS